MPADPKAQAPASDGPAHEDAVRQWVDVQSAQGVQMGSLRKASYIFRGCCSAVL